MRVPFVIYADFEAFTKPMDTSQPNPDYSYVNQHQRHTPCSFCYCIKSIDDSIFPPVLRCYIAKFEDDDVAQTFLDWLVQDVKEVYNNCFKKDMIYGEKEQKQYNESDRCHICGKGGFDTKDKRKVRDHCHFTEKFRGAAHSKCNLQYRRPKFIPIIFHGRSNYDSHLFIKKLQGKNIDVIAKTEKIHSF